MRKITTTLSLTMAVLVVPLVLATLLGHGAIASAVTLPGEPGRIAPCFRISQRRRDIRMRGAFRRQVALLGSGLQPAPHIGNAV